MTPEERQLVDGLFARIRANPPAERDPEAERLIRDMVARDPNAAYAMVQLTLVQEHALRLADERIRQLAQAAPPPSSGRSFLGGMLPSSGQRAGSVPASGSGVWGGGPGAAAPPPFPGQAAPPPYPGQAAPQAQGGGGSFLRTALGTAAGVAGGALLFQGISSLFQHSPGPFGGAPSGGGLFGGPANAATLPADAGPWGGGGSAHEAALDKPFDKPYADDKFADDKDKGYAPDDGGYDPNADAQQDYGDDSFDGGSGGGDDLSNT